MVEIKHLCLCLLFSSTHFSIYKDTFAFYKDTKCVQGHAILMPVSMPACNIPVNHWSTSAYLVLVFLTQPMISNRHAWAIHRCIVWWLVLVVETNYYLEGDISNILTSLWVVWSILEVAICLVT